MFYVFKKLSCPRTVDRKVLKTVFPVRVNKLKLTNITGQTLAYTSFKLLEWLTKLYRVRFHKFI